MPPVLGKSAVRSRKSQGILNRLRGGNTSDLKVQIQDLHCLKLQSAFFISKHKRYYDINHYSKVWKV